MLMTSGARGESQRVRVSLAALLARVHVAIIGPGAIATIGSGILWSLAITGGSDVESRVAPMGAWIMTAVGIVAVGVPAVRVRHRPEISSSQLGSKGGSLARRRVMATW